jgi:DNA modification methylase
MIQYKSIETTLLHVREQLSLFKTTELDKASIGRKISVENWDFADANTKIETHGFHSYPAMMISQIARALILQYGKEHQTLLDPFCGSGTALVEARIHGLNSYGVDINPLALLLARVKSTPLNVQGLKKMSVQLCDDYLKMHKKLKDFDDDSLIPKFFNIEYWFHPKISRELSILRSVILKIKERRIREFFLVAFSQTVRDASYTRNGEFKLFRIPEKEMSSFRANVPKIFFGIVERNLRGMADFARKARKDVFAKVLDEDTRRPTSILSRSVDLVVTSPPYGDSRTTVAYGQFSRLSLQWLGLPWERVRSIDSISLGGKDVVDRQDLSRFPLLRKTIRAVSEEDRRRGQDVSNFFFDMMLCLAEINRVCKRNALGCFVVGNRTVKGVLIPTDEILAEMGEMYGFKLLDVIQRNIPNKRMPLKNSPSNIQGKLGETMTKEHIVVVKKVKDIDGDRLD